MLGKTTAQFWQRAQDWVQRYVDARNALLARLGAIARQPMLQPARAFIGRLIEFGTDGYPVEVKRRLMILNMIAYLIVITTLIYAVQHLFIDFAKYKWLIILNLTLVFVALLVPFAHRINEIAGALLIVAAEYAAFIGFAYLLGRPAGIHLQYFIPAAAAFVVFGLHRWRLVAVVVITGLVLHIYAWFNFPRHTAMIAAEKEVLNGLYVQAAVTTVALISASVYYAFSLAESAKAETDALLRNILPDNVVERLKLQPEQAIADSFDDASILFADLSGFVPLARGLGAQRTVELLNRIVSEFDALAATHRVEKIKTIGDAYMVAAGLPEPSDDHAERLARMALDMLQVIEDIRIETGLEINARVGMASGPVMAGVIGTQKFTYDVWGDTVNLAARLENRSTPGRVLVCPGCFERLAHAFELESHGVVDIKGVGEQETWFLNEELDEPRSDLSNPGAATS